MTEDHPPEDTFSILIASDTHLGYNEDDPITGNDSFVSFEEVLQIGRDHDVDLILLGGDLFHDTRPSPESMHTCLKLLRENCMGDAPISIEFLSDQATIFEHTTQEVVNYEDENLNVSIPVFSIHGNHDDPTGQQMMSSLDILSCAGMVNYIGKIKDLRQISVNPVLLRKGESLLAIYGLGHVADKRLCRLFEDGKVTFYGPEEHKDEWFNILMLHQNRVARSAKNYTDESVLPQMIDLVVWGHEHDCRVEPERNERKQFSVIQPGSSVATSLAEGEAIDKKVAIVKVHKKSFACTTIPLKTVRPFVFRDLCTSEMDLDEDDGDVRTLSEKIEGKAEEIVNEMIEEAKTKLSGHPKQPRLPLIRLRLFFNNESDMLNQVRFGQKFEDKVANPSTVLMQKRRSTVKKENRDVIEAEVLDRAMEKAAIWDIRIEDYVRTYFQDQEQNEDEKYRLAVLSVAGLNEAVTKSVDMHDNNAMADIITYQMDRMEKYLLDNGADEDNIDELIRGFHLQRKGTENNGTQEAPSLLEAARSANATRANGRARPAANGNSSRPSASKTNRSVDAEADDDDDGDEGDEVFEEPEVEWGRGKGRGRGQVRGRGSRGSRAASASAAKTTRGSRGSASTPAAKNARGRGKKTTQQTLQQSLANSSQISVVRTSARSSGNKSRVTFIDDDDED